MGGVPSSAVGARCVWRCSRWSPALSDYLTKYVPSEVPYIKNEKKTAAQLLIMFQARNVSLGHREGAITTRTVETLGRQRDDNVATFFLFFSDNEQKKVEYGILLHLTTLLQQGRMKSPAAGTNRPRRPGRLLAPRDDGGGVLFMMEIISHLRQFPFSRLERARLAADCGMIYRRRRADGSGRLITRRNRRNGELGFVSLRIGCCFAATGCCRSEKV